MSDYTQHFITRTRGIERLQPYNGDIICTDLSTVGHRDDLEIPY